MQFVRRCQNFTFVDEIDADCLKNLRLDEMTDANLCHNRDFHGSHNRLHHAGITHSRHTAGSPNISRHALKSHNRNGTGFFCNNRLLNVDDIHNDAAYELTGKFPIKILH